MNCCPLSHFPVSYQIPLTDNGVTWNGSYLKISKEAFDELKLKLAVDDVVNKLNEQKPAN